MKGASARLDFWYLADLFAGPLVASTVLMFAARTGARRSLLALSIGMLASLAVGVAHRAYAIGFVPVEYATPVSGDGDPRLLATRIDNFIARPAGFSLGLATLVVILLVTAQRHQWRWLAGLTASSVLLIWSYYALFGIYFASYFLNGLNNIFQYGTYATPFNFGQSGGHLDQGPPPGTQVYIVVVSLLLVASALPALLYALRLRDESPVPAAAAPAPS